MTIRILQSPDPDDRKQEITSGPYLEIDQGEVTESTERPYCPHCGEVQRAEGLKSHSMNQCDDCHKFFWFRRIYCTIYRTATDRCHKYN